MGKTIRQVLKDSAPRFLALPDVIGVGIGTEAGKPCLRVYLKRKNPAALHALPREVEGYRVDAVITGDVRALG